MANAAGSAPSPHDWFRPRLAALVQEARAAGMATDISVAVITDLINGPEFSAASLQPEEGWNQDIGEPDYLVNVNDPTSAKTAEQGAFPNPMPFVGGSGRF